MHTITLYPKQEISSENIKYSLSINEKKPDCVEMKKTKLYNIEMEHAT